MIASRLFTPPLPAPPPSPAKDGDSIQPTERLSRSRRDVGEPDKYWPQHSTLKIAMYDYEMDDPYVQAVKQAASEWLPHINLKFEFVSGEEGDVRISGVPIHQGSGVSMVGTDAQKVSPGMPTMNLPIDYSSTSFAHTVCTNSATCSAPGMPISILTRISRGTWPNLTGIYPVTTSKPTCCPCRAALPMIFCRMTKTQPCTTRSTPR